MKFKYRKLNFSSPFTSSRILRPIIPISIKINNTNRKVRYEILIDSGADFNILPMGLIDILNIKSKNLKEVYFSGIDGEIIKGLIAKITISLEDFTFTTNVIFAGISDSIGVLGQYGFFDKLKVSFDFKKKEIEITPI